MNTYWSYPAFAPSTRNPRLSYVMKTIQYRFPFKFHPWRRLSLTLQISASRVLSREAEIRSLQSVSFTTFVAREVDNRSATSSCRMPGCFCKPRHIISVATHNERYEQIL